MTSPYITAVKVGIVFLFLLRHNDGHTPAGIMVRVNKAGFDHLKDNVAAFVTSHIKNVKIPDIKGRKPISYEVRQLKIQDFQVGESFLRPIAPNFLRAGISDLNLTVTGTWSKWLPFEAIASNVSVLMEVKVGVGEDGKPTFTPTDCTASIGNFSLLAADNPSKLYGFMIAMARAYVKNMFENKIICPTLQLQVSIFSKEYHEHAAVYASFFLGTIMDMKLVRPPVAEDDAFILHLSGKCSDANGPMNNSSLDALFDGAHPPSITSAPQQMVQATFGDYVINNFLASLFWNQLFPFDRSLEDVINFFNPDIKDKLILKSPDNASHQRDVMFQTDLLAPPTAYLSSDSITVRGRWQSLAKSLENGNNTELGFFEADVDLVGVITVDDDSASLFLGQISVSNLIFKNVKKSLVMSVFEGVTSEKFLSAANKILQRRTSLPRLLTHFFKNLKFFLRQDCIDLAMDFNL